MSRVQWPGPGGTSAMCSAGPRATRPLTDLEAYRQRMARFMYQSGASMEPVFAAAKTAHKRVAFAEGEDDRVLRTAQLILDEGLAVPVLVGRADVIASRMESLGLRLRPGSDCEVANLETDPRSEETWRDYRLVRRDGVTEAMAKDAMRNRSTLIAAMLLRRGDVNSMLCGTSAAFYEHLHYVSQVIGPRRGLAHVGNDEPAHPQRATTVHLRYVCQPRSDRGANFRANDARCR